MSAYRERKLFKQDCAAVKKHGRKVRLVTSKTLQDYAGMNPLAAKDMHFKGCGKDEYLIRRDLSPTAKRQTLQHEIMEEKKMKKNGCKYMPAHISTMKKIG
jgi:hypothetical protein